MTARDGRRGAALLLALMVVILLEGLAALTLSAAMSRARLVASARDATEGRAIASHGLAIVRVNGEAALRGLSDGDSLTMAVASPLASWRVRVDASRLGTTVRLLAIATRASDDGELIAAQRATLLLRDHGADTLRVISP